VSELRWNPLRMNWVIVVKERGRGPQDYHLERERVTTTSCPFCYGQEAKTTQEVFAIRPEANPSGTSNWKVRVIPNKYPALRIEGDLDKRGVGLYDVMNGVGAHEVIVESPDHGRSMADFSPAEIVDVLKAYRARLLDLRKDHRFRYIIIFKNHGVEAGATIPHPHSQLIAVPITPPVVATKLSVSRDYYHRKERCLMCDMLDQEREEKERLVRDDDHFMVFAPFASSFPFELCIAPRRHSHDFALLGDEELTALAETLKDTLYRLRHVLRDPPYNLVLHNAPPMHLRLGKPSHWGSLPYDYHWHIELVPRLVKTAGFERGTGFHINPTPPEQAARYLREANLPAVL